MSQVDWAQRLSETEAELTSRNEEVATVQKELSRVKNDVLNEQKAQCKGEATYRKKADKLSTSLRDAESQLSKAKARVAHYESQKQTLEQQYESLYRKVQSVLEREKNVDELEAQRQQEHDAKVEQLKVQHMELSQKLEIARAARGNVSVGAVSLPSAQELADAVETTKARVQKLKSEVDFWGDSAEKTREKLGAATQRNAVASKEHYAAATALQNVVTSISLP
eukprot:PhM_4_TR11527/c0_g1_i1/m.92879